MTGMQIEMRPFVRDLADAVAALPERDQSFGQSLLTQLRQKGSLSDKQKVYADKFIAAHKARQSGQTPAPEGDENPYTGIFALFDAAKSKGGMRQPRVTLQNEAGEKFVLSLAGAQSAAPGSINVASGRFGEGLWYGRLIKGKGFVPNRTISTDIVSSIRQSLKELAENPKEAARRHGRKYGFCCFCNRTLTDAVSIENGYGPICAEKFGL